MERCSDDNAENDGQAVEADVAGQFGDDATGDEDQPKRRRRGRRGGRRRRGKRIGEDNKQIEAIGNDDTAINGPVVKNADDTKEPLKDDDSNLDKTAGGHGRRQSVARKSSAKNKEGKSGKTKSTKASNDPSKDVAADTASPGGGATKKKSKSVGKTTRKKVAKKPTKRSAVSYEDGPDGAKTIKAEAKKPVRGRKSKVKRETDTKDAKSADAGSENTAKKQARTSSTKKIKKSAASKTKDARTVPAHRSVDDDNRATNRIPISSAPQDIIDVGSAAPDTRKRGWWSRGE